MVFMVWLAGVHCHTYYLGSCPRVDPVNDFDMSKVRPKYNYFVRSKFSFKFNFENGLIDMT